MVTPAHHALELAALLALISACGEASTSGPIADREDVILEKYLAERPELIQNHGHWHSENHRGAADYGEHFLRFHRELLGQYDEWRDEHGFAPVEPWSPNDPIPASFPHSGRRSEDPSRADPLCRVPSWLTLEGGPQRDVDFGASRLSEFVSSDQLGRAIDSPSDPTWHTRVHANIGGDLANPHRVALDPIFWAFHKFIDGIWGEWLEANGQVDPEHAPSNP